MSNIIVVIGSSGTGKSTSIRNLNPDETFVFNVLSKPLPFRGYKDKYNKDNLNYLCTDNHDLIIKWCNAINDKRPQIKTIIIDDFNFLMSNEFMRRSQEKKFEKFTEMGKNIFNVLQSLMSLRDDLNIYLMCHGEKNESGYIVPKTVGKMTNDYVGISERVTIVLHALVNEGQYKFLTQNDGFYTAKSPLEMFELYEDNDLKLINEKINQYYK